MEPKIGSWAVRYDLSREELHPRRERHRTGRPDEPLPWCAKGRRRTPMRAAWRLPWLSRRRPRRLAPALPPRPRHSPVRAAGWSPLTRV